MQCAAECASLQRLFDITAMDMPIAIMSETSMVCAKFLGGRSEYEQRGDENAAFAACFLVGMDVAVRLA